jgi:hypothetical protein
MQLGDMTVRSRFLLAQVQALQTARRRRRIGSKGDRASSIEAIPVRE